MEPHQTLHGRLEATVHDMLLLHRAMAEQVENLVTGGPSRHSQNHSLYVLLSEKLPKLSFDPLAAIASTAVRNIDHFGIYISNLEGALRQGEMLRLVIRETELSLMLNEIVSLFEPLAKRRRIDVRLEVPAELPSIKADRALLFRAFSNLLDNAIKYSFQTSETSERRFVRIAARRHSLAGAVLIRIESYGVGVLKEEILSGKIFQYGVRGQLAIDEHRHGSGIGLSEAKRIVEAHGGTLHLDSTEVGNGVYLTCVETLLLPVPSETSKGQVVHEFK